MAHLFFFPLSCSFCVLELDLWADFQRFLLLSEAHSDNRPVYLSFAFRCLGEGVIAVYKSDFFFFFKFYLFIFWLHSMWNLSTPTRDKSHAPCFRSMES